MKEILWIWGFLTFTSEDQPLGNSQSLHRRRSSRKRHCNTRTRHQSFVRSASLAAGWTEVNLPAFGICFRRNHSSVYSLPTCERAWFNWFETLV